MFSGFTSRWMILFSCSVWSARSSSPAARESAVFVSVPRSASSLSFSPSAYSSMTTVSSPKNISYIFGMNGESILLSASKNTALVVAIAPLYVLASVQRRRYELNATGVPSRGSALPLHRWIICTCPLRRSCRILLVLICAVIIHSIILRESVMKWRRLRKSCFVR